jgi:hypothetical protein
MKRNAPYVFLFFLLLIVALIFTTADQARWGEATTTPAPWLPPQLSPDPAQPTQTSGWWGDMPTAIPFPTPTQRN